MAAAVSLPFTIQISSLSSRKQSVACSTSSFDLLHKKRFSICSLTLPPSSNKWSAVTSLPRGGSMVIACSSSSSPNNASRPSTRLFVSGIA
ncbi:hypothetical protein IEQ34_019717 [Dendrobium chrysotoxum]|uniref:Uncharacterized protein n=1 Tax=Dendrobium chrysotoxum TaxID=161865 RepID=A0AAV7GAQ3_DENCH|nr:hypothetical protein IEQ34_019717 [Dendrobium chrysotoxum]